MMRRQEEKIRKKKLVIHNGTLQEWVGLCVLYARVPVWKPVMTPMGCVSVPCGYLRGDVV